MLRNRSTMAAGPWQALTGLAIRGRNLERSVTPCAARVAGGAGTGRYRSVLRTRGKASEVRSLVTPEHLVEGHAVVAVLGSDERLAVDAERSVAH